MKEYGGEEFDISFRIWQCGSTLECIPCSHVGHIFRSKQFWIGQAYPVDGKNVIRNKLRTAEVWMDEYKDIPKMIMTEMSLEELGPLDHLLEVKQRLKCKPFKWYLENVFPELQVPVFQRVGEFRNADFKGCVDSLGHTHHGDLVGVYPC